MTRSPSPPLPRKGDGVAVKLADLVPHLAGRRPVHFDERHVKQREKYRRRI
jgi:hypothetical protein